jgi:hypothetical protein
MTTPTLSSTPTTLKFKQRGDGEYVADLPDGYFYLVKKVQRIGIGTIYTHWQAELFRDNGRAVGRYERKARLLTGSKYAPDRFTSPLSDTKREAVTAANAHANGAGNEADKDDRR